MKEETPDGFEIPIFRALTQRLMMMGVPRNLTIALWTIAASVGFGLRQFWILPIFSLLHFICSQASKNDAYFLDIFIDALKSPKKLEP